MGSVHISEEEPSESEQSELEPAQAKPGEGYGEVALGLLIAAPIGVILASLLHRSRSEVIGDLLMLAGMLLFLWLLWLKGRTREERLGARRWLPSRGLGAEEGSGRQEG